MLRILELAGHWPRAMARRMNTMMSGVESFHPARNDVLVCSYFKSGTNWTMQTALQISHRGQADFEYIHDLVSWYEFPDRASYAVSMADETVRGGAVDGLRIIETHLSFDRLGSSETGRYIWVVRDPKDVLVSSYHFVKSAIMGPLMPSVSS